MMSKRCPVCRLTKPAAAFGIRKRDGLLRSHCKECTAAKTREYYRRHTDKLCASAREWRKANPALLRARNKARIAANPERHRAQRKAARHRHAQQIRSYMERYRANNGERTRQRMRERYHEARDARAAYARGYREANPERLRITRAAYRANNLELERAQSAQWRRVHPESGRASEATRRARRNEAAGRGITPPQWKAIEVGALGLCAYCNESRRLTLDHIEALSQGGDHDVDNSAAACLSCNSSKNDTSLIVWLAKRAHLKAAA